ncbi:cation:proton antiporter [Oceanispirochaeta sp.]|jgi:NhaP-type Na+/H+ or K+/H+ antiporter|uniref:cation:proton antiporter n=1 Tax=Oceanispirochaeta sp. TaxID=2035350 RepID=UPI002638733D|nr:cation:proton antiporter [Oceanispirochaeta sp.]MDA3956392.1 cation:proton antiporter [Oceanispirochaeta sp.]
MSLNLLIVLTLMGGWTFSRFFKKVGLPNVLGMIVWGIILGIFSRGNTPGSLEELSPFLKSFALIVILLRAGLGISTRTLARVGKTALLMSFLPCLFEGAALMVLLHLFMDFSWITAGVCSFILAAVSPAVVVPSMLNLQESGLGQDKEIPTIVLAGASLDDVFAITLFSIFLGLSTGQDVNISKALLNIPLSILGGVLPGIFVGFLLARYFRKYHKRVRATEKILLLLGVAILLVDIGEQIHTAALLGVMTCGFILLERVEHVAHELAEKLKKIWIFAEIILFVLIGLSVDLKVAWGAGLIGLLIISGGLVFRSLGVWLATTGSGLNRKERLFCVIAYLPKATVQAAMGSVPLAAGLAEGELILALAVLAILFTAPLGLIGIRTLGPVLLSPPKLAAVVSEDLLGEDD